MKSPTLLDYKAYLTQNSIANSHSPCGPGIVMIYAKHKAENILNLFIVQPIHHLRVGWGEVGKTLWANKLFLLVWKPVTMVYC